MDQDPSVLDFIKTRIRYWMHNIPYTSSAMEKIEEPEFWVEEIENPVSVQASINEASAEKSLHLPWRVLLVLGLGLLAQLSLEPHQGSERTWHVGLFLYVLAGLVLIWINWRQEWILQAWDISVHQVSQDTRFLHSSIAFIVSLVFSLIAFVAFKGNRFTSFNLIVWFIAILTIIRAFWRPGTNNLH